MIGQEEVGGAESLWEERWGQEGEEQWEINREASEREAGGLEKPQVVWDNIDGNRVVGDLPNLGL